MLAQGDFRSSCALGGLRDESLREKHWSKPYPGGAGAPGPVTGTQRGKKGLCALSEESDADFWLGWDTLGSLWVWGLD